MMVDYEDGAFALPQVLVELGELAVAVCVENDDEVRVRLF